MRVGSYFVSGLLGGVLGAVAWVAIAFFTGYSMAWIAWPVGLAVGLSVRLSAKESMGWHIGVIAALTGAVAIGAGKAGMIFLSIETPHDMPIAMVADDVIQERLDAGQTLSWEGESVLGAVDSLAGDYPPDVWDEATIRWAEMSPSTRELFEIAAREQVSAAFMAAFLASFALFDFLWLGFGVVTAYRIGAGIEFADEPVDAPSQLVHVPVAAAKSGQNPKKNNVRRVDRKSAEENNFFRQMRPSERDDLPSLGGPASDAA